MERQKLEKALGQEKQKYLNKTFEELRQIDIPKGKVEGKVGSDLETRN